MQKKTPATSKTAGNASDPIQRARNVLEVLAAAGPQIEAERQLTAQVMAAFHQERLFRVLLPKSLGGDAVDLVTFGKVIETIAAVDASAAWCVSQGGGCAMGAAFLKPDAQKRLFGAPDSVLAWGAGVQGKATAVEGGYRVTGTWTFASGSRHATILGGHSYIFEGDGTPRKRPDGRQLDRSLLFTRDKAKVHDIWHVVGLKGTGSDTFEVKDLFVPEDDTIDRENPAELHEPEPIFQFPATLAYAVGFCSLMLGVARGQLDALNKLAQTKTPRGANSSLLESPVFQTNYAILEARQRSARAYLHQTAGEMYQSVVDGNTLTMEQKLSLKLATTYGINQGVEIATEAYRAAGQTAIFPTNPFERRMRDALTASQQTQGRITNYLTVGRVLLGLPPDSLMFL